MLYILSRGGKEEASRMDACAKRKLKEKVYSPNMNLNSNFNSSIKNFDFKYHDRSRINKHYNSRN